MTNIVRASQEEGRAMILLRCDRCKTEHEHVTMYCVSATGYIGAVLPKGWEIFNGQIGMQHEDHRNKQICPSCADEYHNGFLRTPAGTLTVHTSLTKETK